MINPKILRNPLYQMAMAALLAFVVLMVAKWLGEDIRWFDGYVIFSIELVAIRMTTMYIKKSEIPFFGEGK